MSKPDPMAEDELMKSLGFHLVGSIWGRLWVLDGEITDKDAKAAINAHTTNKIIEELTVCLSEVPMPSLSYEQVQNRIAELKALNHRKEK